MTTVKNLSRLLNEIIKKTRNATSSITADCASSNKTTLFNYKISFSFLLSFLSINLGWTQIAENEAGGNASATQAGVIELTEASTITGNIGGGDFNDYWTIQIVGNSDVTATWNDAGTSYVVSLITYNNTTYTGLPATTTMVSGDSYTLDNGKSYAIRVGQGGVSEAYSVDLSRAALPSSASAISAGDIAVVGMNCGPDGAFAHHNDAVAMVMLADIPGNTTIKITDYPTVDGSSIDTGTSNPEREAIIEWTTASGGVSAGTIVTLSLNTNLSSLTLDPVSAGSVVYNSSHKYTGSVNNNYPFSNPAGDNVFIYTGTEASPTFIYAFKNSSVPTTTAGTNNTFTADGNVNTTHETEQPSALILATGANAGTALSFAGSNHEDNMIYSSATTSGTKDELLTAIGNRNNWSASGGTPYNLSPGSGSTDLPVGGFTITGGCSAPTAQATSAVFGSETATSLILSSFTAPAGGADGYAIYMNDTNSFSAPSDGDEPVADTSWNDAGQQPIYYGTSASPNVSISGLTAGDTYYFQIYAYNDCSGTETYETTGLSANDTTTATLTWDGSTDNDWNTAANWTPESLPGENTDVVIPNTASNYPTASGAVNVNSVDVQSGATLIAQSGITGNVTYTRALGTNNWYLVSFPVSGESVQDLRAANSFASGTGSNIGIAFYDTSGSAWSYYQSASTGNLTNGRGYSVKLSASGDLESRGSFISTDQNVTLVNSGNKFNLLGNPFMSFINSATFLTNETADLASETVWLWDQGTNSYDTFTPGANPNFKIAPGQGFWVEANSANSVAFTESLQSHESTDTFQKTAPRPEIYVHITDQDGLARKTRILYDENATQGFDNGYDGKLFGGASHTFTVFTQLLAQNHGEKYAVQVLPNTDYETQIIPIGIIAEKGKQITFSAEALNLPEGIQVYLEDRENKSITELGQENSNATYQVTLNKDTNGTGRFYLYTRNGVLSTDDLNSLSGVSIFSTDKNTINISGVNSQNASLQIYNVLGKEVLNKRFSSTGSTEINLPKVSTGIYVVHLSTEKGKMTKKIVLE